ncbi:DUF1330 domain-containing protein [Prochlorococcus sp. MIT 1307]|uniref:DUF1330 domain-containing protein n=1 Tax=Prochlorococcus sp. MIT 1307 TaxID=3096219 RepID=UPI002A751016|nr:DUF1330 domain-containing protein [Prochlorococcus sp. MIT 1307]
MTTELICFFWLGIAALLLNAGLSSQALPLFWLVLPLVARLLLKASIQKLLKGKALTSLRLLNFPSKEVASNTYKKGDYQELSKLRWTNSSDPNITIMNGSISH